MNLKLGAFTLIAAISCGAAWSQSNPFAGQTPVKAELKKSFSSRDKVGAEFSATTLQDITLGTTKVPKGSILAGHVVDTTRHSKDTPNGSVTIVFDHITPKKGDAMAITSSLYKILPAEDSMQRMDAPGMRGQASEQNAAAAIRPTDDANNKIVNGMISPSSAPIQVASYIPGVAISAVASDTKSGVLVAKNSDVDMLAGMQVVIGVAPATK
jgi:hypothetical protein